MMNPNMPKSETPPNTPRSIIRGCILALSDIILFLSMVSMRTLTMSPVIAIPMAVVVSPRRK